MARYLAPETAARMAAAAAVVSGALDESQRGGLAIRSLTDPQRKLAHRLIAPCLTPSGTASGSSGRRAARRSGAGSWPGTTWR